ncbi:hypothetical protein KEJ24_09245 [Candidatus Bathyarchaeota archaeon]|nr:hypothetical protein [Candidatus Bathyarchaeota archaeon]
MAMNPHPKMDKKNLKFETDTASFRKISSNPRLSAKTTQKNTNYVGVNMAETIAKSPKTCIVHRFPIKVLPLTKPKSVSFRRKKLFLVKFGLDRFQFSIKNRKNP